MALELKKNEKEHKIFVPLRNEWREIKNKPEELVRQRMICHLVNNYGYSLEQMEQELKVTTSNRGTGRAAADIVIWKSAQDKAEEKNAFIVVECKAESIKIQEKDYFQGQNYATWARANFFVTTNEKDIKFFKINETRMPGYLDEISDIPKASEVNDESALKKYIESLKIFSKTDFQNLLLKCHNIFRDNDALAPDKAFDEISKILFMKINYERNRAIEEPNIFSLDYFRKEEAHYERHIKPALVRNNPNFNWEYVDYWFDDTKNKYRDEKLFDENDRINISKDSFEKVIKALEVYNLSDTDDDIKGIAFEEFLSKTFRGKGLGQYFTPRTIVKFMTEILDPQEGEKICDPCCGSGGFLIYSFEYVRNKIESDIELAKTAIKEKLEAELLNKEKLAEKSYQKLENEIYDKIDTFHKEINIDLNNKIEGTRLNNLSFKYIFGTDKEARSARMAKMNMIMHGDGHGGVHQFEGLLDVNGIQENSFDVVLTNPPFGSRVGRDLKNPATNKPIVDKYEISKFSTLKEVMFVDRCLKLLKPGGRMGIVLPEGFLNNSELQNVRDYVEGKAKIVLICSIPQDVFVSAGATVKPSLVFLKKFTEKEKTNYLSIVETVTSEIAEKYKPSIDNVNNDYQILVDELNLLNKKVSDLKKQLKKKDADIISIQNQIDETISKIILQKQTVADGKKLKDQKLKEIENKKTVEIKAEVKIRFDYQIPIVQVEKAGINATGGMIENELPDVVNEFTKYRKATNLWQSKCIKYDYEIENNKIIKKSETLFG